LSKDQASSVRVGELLFLRKIFRQFLVRKIGKDYATVIAFGGPRHLVSLSNGVGEWSIIQAAEERIISANKQKFPELADFLDLVKHQLQSTYW
jgi:hypothetical protein